ncbi:MAG: J domain-containing protein [Caulobacteraceae bacterium]
MATAFQYRPRFVDIRVRPPKAEEEARADDVNALKPGERACDHQGCRAPAAIRAPKSRDMLGDHYWFCQPHAAQYNRTWNFFAGMSEGEIRARVADEQATGGRPTWSFKGGARNREAAGQRGFFRDPFGIFGAGKPRDEAGAAHERRLGRLERGALADLDLDALATGPAIRVRYLELVKRCHPDANGGDRSAEHKLQRVIKAYKTLRKAQLV